ncbi:MAG: hypothetical protein AMXMBFR33_21970 [Candidatus Xenobia bacterium]
MAVMFVLATLAMGLHWQQARARAAYLREESAVQARQSVEFKLADEMTTLPLTPPEVQVKASQQSSPPYDLKFGSRLYTGLPALNASEPVSWDPARQALPGPEWRSLKPTTLNPSLMAPASRRFLAVTSPTLPYGVLAPQGAVSLESAAGWSNPTFPETVGKDARIMFSAVPVKLGAGTGLSAKTVHYGEVYLKAGPLDLEQGSVVAFQGYLPCTRRDGKEYNAALGEQIQNAYSVLSVRGQNKTDSIKGSLPGLDDIWDLITGSKSFESIFGSALSLRQSLEFPFPMIPGGNELGIVTNIWLHMPYPPDGAVSGSAAELNAQNDKLKEITDKMALKQKEIEELEAKIPTLDPGPERDAAIMQLAALKAEMEDLVDDAQEIGEQNADKLKQDIQSSNPDDDGPDTRADEGGLGEDGQMGWAYSKVFEKILGILGDLVTGDFEGLANQFLHRVRVVHFGPKDNKTTFNITDGSFDCPATLNVPSGRALRFDGNLTVRGDLWIQKGGSLTVNGDLTLISPLVAPSDDLLTPQGRLCLEEGATVLVSGDFTCAGSPEAGSVLVAGPVNQVHPVTSGLLVQGDVTIPYGVYPAMTLDGLATLVPALAEASTALTTVSSNLAKAAGPFHRRKPYFARYATTFQIVKWPFPPAIIPMAVPLPTPKNVLNPMFSSIATIYQVQLNLVLGENFVTFTDWWILGKGVVPMLPKVDPAALAGLSSLSLPVLPEPEDVVDYVKDYALDAGKDMIADLMSKVVTSLIQSQLGFPMSLVGDFAGSAVAELTKWVTEADDAQKLGGSGGKMALDSLADQIESLLNGGAVKPLLAECTGVLIYSGGDLRVNSSGLVVPVAVGFLVARGNVSCSTEYLVGAATSETGSVTARNLLYVPEFTRISLYLPRNNPNLVDTGLGWLDWALEPAYGKEFDSQQSVEIGPARPHTLTDSWDN